MSIVVFFFVFSLFVDVTFLFLLSLTWVLLSSDIIDFTLLKYSDSDNSETSSVVSIENNINE
jgi:hypothetical protein